MKGGDKSHVKEINTILISASLGKVFNKSRSAFDTGRKSE
jgi:hypothetical protein